MPFVGMMISQFEMLRWHVSLSIRAFSYGPLVIRPAASDSSSVPY